MSQEDKHSVDLRSLDKMEDPAALRAITRYRQNVVGLLKPDYVYETICQLIEGCPWLDYKDERARKMAAREKRKFRLVINYQESMFEPQNYPDDRVLKILKEGIKPTPDLKSKDGQEITIYSLQDNGKFFHEDVNALTSYNKNLIRDVIIEPFTAIIFEKSALLTEENLTGEENPSLAKEREKIFTDHPELKAHIRDYITTTLFRVFISIQDNYCYVEFLM